MRKASEYQLLFDLFIINIQPQIITNYHEQLFNNSLIFKFFFRKIQDNC